MASITIEAGQLDGVVYADSQPPMDESRLSLLNKVCERDRVKSIWITGAQFELAPDPHDYGDKLGLTAKKRLLEMADVLVEYGDEVTVIETKIGWGYWLFDEDAKKTPIDRAVVEKQGSNEDSLSALAGMMGGWGPLLAQSDMADIGRLLDADPDDELSGLREVARHSHAAIEYRPIDDVVSPEAARHWLLVQGRAVETPEGKLVIPKSQKKIDHITLAGLEIALGTESLSFDEAYREVSSNGELEPGMLREIGRMIMNRYAEDMAGSIG